MPSAHLSKNHRLLLSQEGGGLDDTLWFPRILGKLHGYIRKCVSSQTLKGIVHMDGKTLTKTQADFREVHAMG